MDRRAVYQAVKEQLLDYLRQGSIYDSDDPRVIGLACEEQERIAKRIERAIRPPRRS